MHVVHPTGAAMAAGIIAGPDMDAHFPGNTPRRTGEAHQTGREYPERQRPLALMQQGISEVVEGARVALAPGASAAGAVVVCAPVAHVVALAARTWPRPILPPECMDGGLALCSVTEVV